jgi:phospholipid/cholesterol/gamma-HCH transport system permease protein
MSAEASSESPSTLPREGGLSAAVGRAVFEGIDAAGEMYSVLVRTLYYVARARTDRDAVIRQMYEIGNRSVFLLTVVIGFIGMIFVLQAGLQMQRVIPDLTMLGAC